MALLLKTLRLTKARQLAANPLSEERGNVLIYVVLLMVIFGLLGVTMVSLFSTSISSSGTRNDTRRAFYMAESGIRYGVSQLRDKDFVSKDIDDLNTTTFKLPPGEFKINVFGPWFESPTDQDIGGTGTLNLKVTEGKIPHNFLEQIPAGDANFWLVNRDYINFDPNNPNNSEMRRRPSDTAIAQVSSFEKLTDTTFNFTIDDSFVVAKGEEICLSVRPTEHGQSIAVGGTFNLPLTARNIFPRLGGAFEIRKRNFSYREARALPESNPVRIQLTDIKTVPPDVGNQGPESNIQIDESIILTSRNHIVTAEGKYDQVTYPATAGFGAAVADRSVVKAKSRKPDIDFEEETNLESKLKQLETSNNTSLFTVDNDPGNKFITIGAGSGPSFGALWFKDTRSIGGLRNFCSAGACQFGLGVRVFFTFTATGDSGEGFIFSLTNGQENSIGSVGGDIQQSELLGYSGDSRVNNPDPPTSPNFLDGTGKGLQAPKIGLEFDTRVNYDPTFEQNQRYCTGKNLNVNTRNDPLSSDKHAIQYVFWAKDNLNLSCRDTLGRATYDDNRHDAVGFGTSNWAKNLSGSTNSDPVIRSSDGTIYIGSAAHSLFAVKPDGTDKWTFGTPTGEVFSPVLRNDRILFNSADNKVYAVNPSDGHEIWNHASLPALPGSAGSLTGKPALDSDYVYVNTDRYLFKLNGVNGNIALFKFFSTEVLTSPPVLSRSGQVLYIGFNDNKLHARNISNLEETAGWPSASIGQIIGSPTVDKDTGFIYVSTGNGVYKINPAAPTDTPTRFPSPGGSDPTSSPTLSRDGFTVYIGFSNGRLYALNTSDLNPKWSFPTIGSIGTSVASPEVDDNENIYVGSSNNFVYALFSDGSVKWEFDTGGAVTAKPAVDQNGTVYAGSNSSGGRLLAINQFTEPRNYRQNFENPPKPELAKNLVAFSDSKAVNPYYTNISNTNKWFKDGPWAVRIEVDRVPLSGDRADYTLRTWVQQCTDIDCTNVRGTFFEDTRIRYNPVAKPPNIVQSFQLDSTLNLKFNSFLFGFTSAKRDNSDDQLITVDNFQLSFNRPGDPEVIVE
jgi:outer membrane protein assembly factor BamB